MRNHLLGHLHNSVVAALIVVSAACSVNPAGAQPPTAPTAAVPTPRPEVRAGEIRYGVRRVNTEVLVPISLETGDAELSPESTYRLSQLPRNAYPTKPVEISLHPAGIEDGIVGSWGITPELRASKTREVLHMAYTGHSFDYHVREARNPILGFGDSSSVSQIHMEFDVEYTFAKVLYVTDRGPRYGSDGRIVSYDNTEPGRLSYGLAILQINKHLDKPVAGPWDWVTRFFKGDPKPPSTDKLSTRPIADFAKFSFLLARNLRQATENQILVYIHGYRTSFDQVVQDATVLGHLTKFPGPVIVYSWPSDGTISGYDHDYEAADRTIPRFQDFLESLRAIPGVKRIDVVAHSMGSRVLFWALKGRTSLHLNEVVMVAGDVAQEDFKQYFKDVRPQATRFTIYSTQTDFALFASSKLHNAARVGFSAGGDTPFMLPGMDAIDATAVVQDLLSHGYQLNSDLPRTDIIYALRSDPIDKRGCLEWNNGAMKDFLHYTCR
jgi:esterase/lipase superfamily enzyme